MAAVVVLVLVVRSTCKHRRMQLRGWVQAQSTKGCWKGWDRSGSNLQCLNESYSDNR
jgi:hypothetical protein